MTKTTTLTPLPSPCRGFSLIEVLVTMVIVATGLLGIASLMLKGLQSNASSQLRSVAVTQAYDMADRIRANYAGVVAGSYGAVLPSGSSTTCTTTGLGTTAHVAPPSSTVTCATSCVSASCTTANVAARDACLWHKRNQTLLPLGAGAVCKNAANNWFTIYVSWDENKSGATNKTFTLRFEP